MQKTILIEGMMCQNCAKHAASALNNIEGVTAVVDLASKTATVTFENDVTDEMLTEAIEDAGYEVVEIR